MSPCDSSKGTISGFTSFPDLPTGITLNAQNGRISGTPTATQVMTFYTITAGSGSSAESTVIAFDVVDYAAPTGLTYMYNGEIETAKATFDFKYTEDYVTKFSVEAPTAQYNPGEEIKEQSFTFKATGWASGENYENNSSKNSLSSSQFEIEPNYVPFGYWLDTNAKETIEINDITPDATDPEVKYAVLDDTSKVSITVKKPASEG